MAGLPRLSHHTRRNNNPLAASHPPSERHGCALVATDGLHHVTTADLDAVLGEDLVERLERGLLRGEVPAVAG